MPVRTVAVDSHTRLVYDGVPERPVFVSTTRANLDRAYDDAQERHGYPFDRGEWQEGDGRTMICAVWEDDEVHATRTADEARERAADARAAKHDERAEK